MSEVNIAEGSRRLALWEVRAGALIGRTVYHRDEQRLDLDIQGNFRVINEGGRVEVNMRLTIDADAVMHGWPQLQRDLLAVEGVRTVKVDDLPLALVSATMADRVAPKPEGFTPYRESTGPQSKGRK